MRVLSSLLILHFILILQITSNCQTASTGNGLSEIYPTSNISSSINSHDPIHEWPVCTDPKDIIIVEDRKNFIITWDGEEKLSNKYQYEILFADIFGNRIEEPTLIDKNSYKISKNVFGRMDKAEIQIRRICFNETSHRIYSNWVTNVLAINGGGDGGGNGCDASGGSISGTSTCVILGFSFNLNNVVLPSGCSTGDYSYVWQMSSSSNSGFQNIPGAPDAPSITTSISSLNAGTYYFRRVAYCNNGEYCQTSATFLTSNVISVYAQNNFNVSISGNSPISCGQSSTLTASGGVSYQWSHNLGAGAIKTVTPTTTTTYTVTVTNANGCTKTATKTVSINSLPIVSISGNSPINCGLSTTLTASGGGTYNWSNGLGTGAVKTVIPTTSTTYTVTVTGSNGCTNSAQKTIIINNLPVATISGNSNICSGQSTTLTASGGSTYVWSHNLGTGAVKSISPSVSTTYTVTVTNSSGCYSTAAITINVLPAPSVSISANNAICIGQSTTLTASGGVSYQWSNGLGLGAIKTVTPTVTTTYTVTVTGVNGCTSTGQKVITVNPLPIANISGISSICLGQSTTLTASGGSTYAWSENNENQQTITISPTATTTFTVTVTSEFGCSSTSAITINVNPSPPATITGNTSICAGQSTTLTASGGTTYLWSNNETTASITVSPMDRTVYTVSVSNAQSCVSTASVEVQLIDNNQVSVSITDPIPCVVNSAKIKILEPTGTNYTYSIDGGPYQQSTIFQNVSIGSHVITYLNSSSTCNPPATTVEVNGVEPGISEALLVNSFDQFECNPNNSSINIISPLGSQYDYSLNDGPFQANPVFSGLLPGNYTITYRNILSGCRHPNIVTKNIDGFPCEQDPEFLCNVTSNFIALIQNPNSFNLVAPDNFLDVLENQDISVDGVNYQLNFVSNVKLELNYEENNEQKNRIFDFFDESMYTSGLQDFNISDLTVLVDNVNTENFSGSYRLVIKLKDGSVHLCNFVNLNLTTETVVDPDNPNNFPELPVLNCTTVLDPGDVNNSIPKTSLVINEIISIKAFPIKLTEISDPNPNGIYTGLGIMPIPFGSKNVLVSFTNVFVNELGIITSGSVSVVSGGPTPSIVNPNPLVIGGDICLPPPPPPSLSGPGGVDPASGLDPYGFNPATGLHMNNTPYDGNGFDINGYYKNTDPPSLYDPNGCNRNGYDAAGDPCSLPYVPNNPIGPVVEFLNQNGDKIDSDVIRILNALKDEATTKLNALNCNALKTDVLLKNLELDYPECYAVGASNKYINTETILDWYNAPLKKSDLESSEKNYLSTIMENKHVDLYECALKAKKYQTIIDIINEILSDNSKLEVLQNYVTNQIEKWSEEEAAKYINSQSELDVWMTQIIKNYIVGSSGIEGLFSLNAKRKFQIIQLKHEVDYIDYYHSMASINDVFPDIQENDLNEIDFYMKQDFQNIKGIDRAFYLDAMTKNISLQDQGNNVHVLPITIEKNVGNLNISLILDNITIDNTIAKLNAYIIVEDPESGRKIVFKGLNIAFGTNGPVGNNKVFLGNDVELRINNASKLILKGNPDTYIQFNCEGFNGMGIDAEIEFCRNFIIPLTAAPDLSPIADPARYRLTNIKVQMDKWMDFSFTMNAPPFAMAKYENIKFQLTNMILDMSSAYSPSFKLPDGYKNPVAGSPGWKGFYIENITVTFPNEFNKDNIPSVASIHNFIIDGTGVSGEGEYTGEILSLTNGRIGGWAMSINSLGLKFLHNHFSEFSLKGQMEVPLFEEPFNYIGHVYPNQQYKFTVLPKTDLTCDLFLAEASLTEGSGVSIGKDALGFNITATLNGKIKVKGADNVPIDLPEMNFEGVTLSNRFPYFSPGNWPIPKDVGLEYKAFALNMNSAKLYKPDPLDPLSAGLLLDVTTAFDSGISIMLKGGIGITGKLNIVDGKQKWKFEKIKVENFCIGGSFPGVDQIVGCLQFYENDPDYGSGFKGGVYVAFSGFLDELKAVGQFGKFNNQSYFFVDASASLQKSIPLFAGIELKGFSGGLSYKMTSTFDPANLNFTDPQVDFAEFSSELGVGFSGMSYSVDFSKRLGLKAGAMFNLLGQDELFNGALQIGIEFNDGGGLASAYLNGIGQFLAPMDISLPIKNPLTGQQVKPVEVESVLSAYIFLQWVPGHLNGTVEAFLNAGPLKGSMDGGKMVNIDLAFSSGSWHIYMGHPDIDRRCGVDLDLELFRLHFDAYLCMGSQIPDMPELPDNVKQIVPKVKSNGGLRGGSGGIVFGASFKARVDLDLLGIISAEGEIGAGFDVMLRKYNNMTCAGGNGDPIGINGWYGAGQVYAYVTGSLKVLGFNIISAGMAAVLQARLPNPSWVQGTVGLYLDTWLYSGHYDLAISVGENCNIVSTNPSNITGIDVIANTNPIGGAEDVNVDLVPEINFSLPINKSVKITDLNGNKKEYFVKVDSLYFTYGDLNEHIEFTEIWKNNNQKLILKPKYFLPEYTSHKLFIKVLVYEGANIIAVETREVNFVTGESLKIITESNIKSTFPVNSMKNFHKDQIDKEFIELNQGLYDVLRDENYNISILLNDNIEIPVSISNDATLIEFDISSHLSNEQTYKLDLIRNPKNDKYAKTSSATKSADGTILYTIQFRTSKYSTFGEKVAQINTSPLVNNPDLGKYKTTDEAFDEIEFGTSAGKYAKLVSVSTDVGPYFLEEERNLLNSGYIDDLLTSHYITARRIDFDIPDPYYKICYIGGNNRIHQNYYNAMNEFYDKLANKINPFYLALIKEGVDPNSIPENAFYRNRNPPKLGSDNYFYSINYRLPNGKIISSHEVLFK